MKRCSGCHRDLPLAAFAPRSRSHSRDGLKGRCRDCINGEAAVWVERNRDKVRQTTARRKQALRDRIVQYLAGHPCVDCGEADVVVLQFDHLGDKVANVTVLANRGWSWPKILAEIEKCEVVCANCHVRRTARRAGWSRVRNSAAECLSDAEVVVGSSPAALTHTRSVAQSG